MRIRMFDKFGVSFGIRKAAREFRSEIENKYTESDEKIIFDMEDVRVISSSFADELVAKLYTNPKFRNRIQITNYNDTVKLVIAHSINNSKN